MFSLLAFLPFLSLSAEVSDAPRRRRGSDEPEPEPEPLRKPAFLVAPAEDPFTVSLVADVRREHPLLVGAAAPPVLRYRHPELAVACPRSDCRAAPGEPCDRRTRARHRFHKARVDAAREAG